MAATLQRILEELGDNVRLARLRRKLSATQVAERAGMGRTTLTKIEQGHQGMR
jgi:transcriptional regulator with XRE-family HTH domain